MVAAVLPAALSELAVAKAKPMAAAWRLCLAVVAPRVLLLWHPLMHLRRPEACVSALGTVSFPQVLWPWPAARVALQRASLCRLGTAVGRTTVATCVWLVVKARWAVWWRCKVAPVRRAPAALYKS